MQAVVMSGYGDTSVLSLSQCPDPCPADDELLVAVTAAGVNRADIMQRRGYYPPPQGASEILGLEIAGEVVASGSKCSLFKKGDRVFGLVEGGGYGSLCTIKEAMAMATPDHWSDSYAASIPEVFYTANETLCTVGGLKTGEEVLIHAGGSGVGSTAIQMAAMMGARVATTASTDSKLARCAQLGADLCINYKHQDFVAECRRWSKASGPDLVLDFVGAAYLERHLEVLRPLGRLVVIGLLGGASAPLNLSLLLRKRIQIKGSVMRSLSLADKLAIKARFLEKWLPGLLDKSIEPVICERFPITNVRDAHEMMEQSNHFGKLILNFV